MENIELKDCSFLLDKDKYFFKKKMDDLEGSKAEAFLTNCRNICIIIQQVQLFTQMMMKIIYFSLIKVVEDEK